MSVLTRVDLHVHTKYSYDGLIDVADIINVSRSRGIQCIAITDHDTMAGYENFSRVLREKGLIVIPGIEVTTSRGHVILLDIEPPYELTSRDFYDVVDYARDNGALVVIPHPMDTFRSFDDLHGVIDYVDGVEVANGSDLMVGRHVGRLLSLTIGWGKFATAGSDAHIAEAIGSSHLYINEELGSQDDVIKYLVDGKFSVYVGRTPLIHRLRKILLQYLPLSRLGGRI